MLNWMRILPLARERDGLKSVSTNFETFDDIVDCLGHGVPFCMFSEGRHRPERGMLPVKKGIFRVCKLALDRLGGPVYIVPVGLDYQYFFRQGGSVDLRIGKPIDIEDYMTRGETAGEAAAYRELCEVLQQRILALIGKVPERKGRMLLPRLLAALVLLPLTLATCILSLPIWLPARLILRNFKDKAWTHTVFFAMHLLLPVFMPFHWLYNLLANFTRDAVEDLTRKR